MTTSVLAQCLPPGIYFNLEASRYHNDPALGSGDLRRILKSAPDYWWSSSLNPLNHGRQVEADVGEEFGDAVPDDVPPEKLSHALLFGRACHTCILDGEFEFRTLYAPTDNPGNVKAGKDERARIRLNGMTPLKRADFDRILVAGSLIRANPQIAPAFEGGAREVSVFWRTPDGVPLKCRFDNLKRRVVADLKTIRNTRQKDFYAACRLRLTEHRLDIQAEHYLEGRAQLAQFVREDRVFGDHDPEWLDDVASAEDYTFCFAFWQADGAPISWGFYLTPGNPILSDHARPAVDRALARYREFTAKFNAGDAWLLSEPVQELDLSELPVFFGRD